MIFVIGLWTFLRVLLFGAAAVALENLALRHQLLVLGPPAIRVPTPSVARARTRSPRARECRHDPSGREREDLAAFRCALATVQSREDRRRDQQAVTFPKETDMHSTRNDLSKLTRAKAIELLDARLADATDLQTQLKQAHWNVKGPTFIALHELFDKINEAVEDYVDDLARLCPAQGRNVPSARRAAVTPDREAPRRGRDTRWEPGQGWRYERACATRRGGCGGKRATGTHDARRP
jgi:hypothetical protein